MHRLTQSLVGSAGTAYINRCRPHSGCWGARLRNGVLDHLQSEHRFWVTARSEVELGSSPVSSACVVPDFVVSSISDPVGQGTVLLDLFGVTCFLTERLDGSHFLNIL